MTRLVILVGVLSPGAVLLPRVDPLGFLIALGAVGVVGFWCLVVPEVVRECRRREGW